ncbi:thioredoxin-dependent thiol peroxidase [Corynebacterium anserum]|uniref:thioredoxin-dependent peroxiredoxin n=1 Tax=Corynebacterium anserum TaxID=2684406 RepID=A0A7G7YMG1_9CORY|nr:thioredoxin-dependent thiol peroxidase [Corynebacterium anserum]MBC2681047.1 thioredoxin-dependent thiol peroxidase [Corynebacterium anserum]QNH95681.1 thioredoxin-dependent thiol peroxidase [Corynebacterium anserum]
MTENNTAVRLEEGVAAPDFTLVNADGEKVSLADFKRKKVIIYFYPKADTPGCTTEACDFRDSLTQLNGQDIAVVGISPDQPEALKKFSDKYELTFPLLSDADKTVMKAYGAFGEKKNYGKVVQGVIRSTFLVDEEGTIALAKYNVKATGHVARIIKEIGA